MSTKPLLKESFLILNICGMNPLNQNILSRLKTAGIIFLLTYMIIEVILQLVFNWKGWESSDGFIVCAALLQMLNKAVFITFKRGDLILTINNIEFFWAWNNFPNKIQEKITNFFANSLKIIKVFGISCLTCVGIYAFKPYFSFPLKTLPFETYHPKDCNITPNYQLMYFLQIFNCTLGALCIIGFDSLFIALVVHIICEIKLLKQKFTDVKINNKIMGDEKKPLDEISKLVFHHNFVLEIIKDIDNIYSVFLLNQFSSSIIWLCSGLLSVAASDFPPDLSRSAKCVSFLLVAVNQLLIYCFVGEYLKAESASLADAVYETEWWVKTQPKLRKAYVMVIQRSQKSEKLSAGGMFPLNLQTFTSIMNFALSFFTMVQAMYSRRNNN